MKIWVYLNDIQQGPYTLEQIAELPLTPSTPVWYEGLQQWQPAGEAPATAALFNKDNATHAETTHRLSETSPSPATERQFYSLNDNFKPAVDAPDAPPTFIGWSVFLLLCCCPPAGILGIILSIMSGNAYRAGDYAAAARRSEWAEWTVILGIVIGLMLAPFGWSILF